MRRRPRMCGPLALGALCLLAGALRAQVPADATVRSSVDSIARRALAQSPVASISIMVTRGRDTVVRQAYGLASIEDSIPATPGTVYRVGSITKQFTASMILRLAEQGRLSLDDSITKYLPDFPLQGHDVRIRHLLTHTSGIRSYTSLGSRWASRMGDSLPPDSIIALFAHEPFDFEPGTKFLYDNSGYFLLGRIIEVVTGQPYARFLEDSLLAPLGLAHTRYCPDTPVRPADASGYAVVNDSLVPSRPLSMTHPYAAGAICSTTGDLVAWTRALFGGRVVPLTRLRQMTAPTLLANGDTSNYGFGIAMARLNGHRWIGHGGAINGFGSQLVAYPDDSVIVAVLASTEGEVADDVARSVARAALGITVAPPRDLAIPSRDLERLPGAYSARGFTITVTSRGGQLFGQPSGQKETRLLYQGGDVYLPEVAPEQQLRFDAGTSASTLSLSLDGRVIWSGRREGSAGGSR